MIIRLLPVFLWLFLCTILISSCKDSKTCDLDVTVLYSLGSGDFLAIPIVHGGEEPYSYLWSTGETTLTIHKDSSIEFYSVTVTDFNGCMDVDTFGSEGCDRILFLGEYYPREFINGKCWMTENARLTTGIPHVQDSAAWTALTTPAWCYYNNDSTHFLQKEKLYNWYAVQSGLICPNGYHIPTQVEWLGLINTLGGESVAGLNMKEHGYWDALGNSTQDLNVKPAGRRLVNGQFVGLGTETFFWTSTEDSSDTRGISYSLTNISSQVFSSISDKRAGYSCRCVSNF